MSPATASICAMTRSVETACHVVTPRVFCAVTAVIARRAVDAVRGERLEVGLDAGAAARIAARNCQCCDAYSRIRATAMHAIGRPTLFKRDGRDGLQRRMATAPVRRC